ncbi:hypothetical protein BH11PSE11_BH11PSE11_05020 [soil metagenome]
MINESTPFSAGAGAAQSQSERQDVQQNREPDLLPTSATQLSEPIAVVGIGCRFPGGANSPDALWRLLIEGRDGIVDVPVTRWDIDAWYDADRNAPGKMNMRRAGFLQEDIAEFDGAFFGVAPREALAMDPQQRLLLEVSWEALENAAIPAERVSGKSCGVFVGLYNNNYGLTMRGSPAPEIIDGWSASGAHTSVAAGRLSYFLNLTGPSIAVDTACSSSLVAVHLALQSLRSGECDMALAGGAHLLLSPEALVASAKLGATAADGRCKTFDAAADGFGHGEGCGVVVLKRLADAEAAGDRVLAVIRGSCVNQDGRSNSLTAPNGPAQEAAVRTALQRAGIAPRLVGYVEAHGTGTQLGDPIEVEALADVLGEERDVPLMLGSIKTNLGHLEAAAGIAGLIKTILCVQHGVVPAHLNFSTLNPEIEAGGLQLKIPLAATRWDGIDGRRIAGVSAFGFSGTNAHVVLEAYADAQHSSSSTDGLARDRAHALVLSARTPQALTELANRWADWLQTGTIDIADAAYTAGAGRSHHRHRIAVAGNDVDTLTEALRTAGPSVVERTPRIAFLFTGQGSQYAGMAARAYETQPVFRATLDRFAPLLDRLLGQPALPLLFGTESIDGTALAQPLVVAMELALAAQWQAWGIAPVAVMGHSVGEYTAAAVAGVLSEEAVLTLVAERGRLMQALPAGGGMLVVSSSASRVEPLLKDFGGNLAIAAMNGPANTAVAGELAALDRLQEHLQSNGMRNTRLPVSHAFHSALLDPMLGALQHAATAHANRAPRIPIVSNLTGKPHQQFDAAHWRAHARQPVHFFEGMQSLVDLGCDTFLEIGPQAVLSALGAATQPDSLFATSLRRNVADDLSLAQAQAALYRAGAALAWDAVHAHQERKKLAAPTYPFQRESYWLSLPAAFNLTQSPRLPTGPASQTPLATGSAVVYDFYDELTVISEQDRSDQLAEDDEGHLTFGFLPAPVPGFSWIRALFEKEENPGARAMFLSSQRELKDNLFAGIDFSNMRRVLDYGCGHAADLCELAMRHPQLQLQGFTISAGQVEVGKRRIARLGLGQRVQLQRSDSSAVPFPGSFDLIFGFEVTGLIANKEGLFDNIAAHLAPGGLLVIADFVSTADAIVNPETNSFTPSSAQWVDLLSTRRLRLVRSVDASADVAAWLVDPDFESNIEQLVQRFKLGDLTRRHLLSNENIGKALRLNLMRYLLLTAQHAPHETEQTLRVANEAMLRDAVQYRDTPAARASEPWRQWLYRVDWQNANSNLTPTRAWVDTAAIALQLAGSVRRERESLARYDTLGVVLDDISLAYVEAAFCTLGCKDLDAASQVPVIEPMRRLRDHLVKTLSAAGAQLLRNEGNPDALADHALRAHPAAQAELTLLRRCGPRLADALMGRVDPLSLLFPDGDASLAEALYERSPFSRAVQQLAAEIIATLPRERPLAVIEIGAGTGATTEHVLPQLPSASRYLYTDLGTSMLTRARNKFAGRGLSFAPLDIGLPPAAQGIATAAWDVVIAANVLHATPDLALTVSHVKDLLAPGGLLLLVENTGRLNWGDLTFGLTPGMWNFRDTDLRDYALLYQAQWKTLLENAGFEGVEIFTPGEADRGGVSQQCVIIARRRAQRHWLLIGAEREQADALAAGLKECGHACSVAPIASNITAIPAEVTDVVYLAPHGDELEPRAVLEPALAIAQAVAARAEPPRLALVSAGAYQFNEFSQINHAANELPVHLQAGEGTKTRASPNTDLLAHAGLPGFARTVFAERPDTRCRLIDLDPSQASAAQIGTLASELINGSDGEVAFRNGERKLPRLHPIEASLQSEIRFDPQASYIVTGAFGGIGLELLKWMALRGARKLMLSGRSAPTPQAELVLQSLRERGVTAQIHLLDVGQGQQVEQLIDAAQALAPLKGVLHAAGVVADAALDRQDWPHFETVFAAKVHGARHLHEATATLALDHFVLFSSAAALLGPSGQVNHATANAFLTGLVRQRRQQGLPALSIDWGAWAEVGAATRDGIGAQVERSGLIHMQPDQALRALEWAMAAQQESIAVLAVDWSRYVKRFHAGGVPTVLRDVADSAAREAAPQSSTTAPAAAARPMLDNLRETLSAAAPLRRRDLLLAAIRKEAARVMGIADPLSIDDARPLRDLGLDSLMSIELRNVLVLRAGAKLPATLLFDNPSVAALADALAAGVMADLFAADQANNETASELDALDAAALSDLLDAELRDVGAAP